MTISYAEIVLICTLQFSINLAGIQLDTCTILTIEKLNRSDWIANEKTLQPSPHYEDESKYRSAYGL